MYEKIKNPINPAIAIGTYTKYISDHTDEYTYFIGMQVAEHAECPTQLERLTIPAGTYVEFTTQIGKMPDILISTWQKIWQMSSQDFGAERAYDVDFELYDQVTTDYNNVQSKIYIGIKNS
ncbi:MAG TPA: effector binding domain-containing protein [Patescibacteria group bacterium]|nr:effector binding domain-containing protein [Patescibacteria group bacterium]